MQKAGIDLHSMLAHDSAELGMCSLGFIQVDWPLIQRGPVHIMSFFQASEDVHHSLAVCRGHHDSHQTVWNVGEVAAPGMEASHHEGGSFRFAHDDNLGRLVLVLLDGCAFMVCRVSHQAACGCSLALDSFQGLGHQLRWCHIQHVLS